MILTLKPTAIFERVNGVKCRRWDGATDAGTPVRAFIPIIQPQTHDEASSPYSMRS